MNVLVVHNRYRETGGEDRVVENESALLARGGHTVVPYTVENSSIDSFTRVALACKTVWNAASYKEVRTLLARERITVMHVHNTLPLASPAVYYAAAAEGVPVVQTLHNYRLLCPNALCFRNDAPCVECVTAKSLVPAVRHACYRGSMAATATVAAMLRIHQTAGTWQRKIDTYIAPSEFARAMFVSGGLPADRIVVKPHFVDLDPGIGTGRGGYAVFVGRLSPEKGIATLLDAWAELQTRMPLVIVGDGPMAPTVAAAASQYPGITWLGRRPPGEVHRLIGDAAFLVFPSVVYETFGQVIVEAYAAGTPVIVSAGGSGEELVRPSETGLLARPGDARSLVAQVDWLLAHADRLRHMRAAARAHYEARFTAVDNYRQLVDIYERAAQTCAAARGKASLAATETAA